MYGAMDLNRDNYMDVEITDFNDTTRTGHIDTIELRINGSDKIRQPLFFVISDGKNNFPWDSNISKINGSGNVEIKASSGLAAVKSKGFRVRIAEKGKPELNVVTDLEKDFVCQPAIKDPHFQVWEDSIKIKEKTPFLWEPERNHRINYSKTDNGIKVSGRGAVLTQHTSIIPDSVKIRSNGRLKVVIQSSEGVSLVRRFSGSTNTALNTSRLRSRGEYKIRLISEGRTLKLQQFGNGECAKSINKN